MKDQERLRLTSTVVPDFRVTEGPMGQWCRRLDLQHIFRGL
jgi:hypothetical protein